MTLNRVRTAARNVYKTLGCGHTELTYTRALALELCNNKEDIQDLRENGTPRHTGVLHDYPFQFRRRLPIKYNGDVIGYAIPDVIVGGTTPVELKAKSCITQRDVSQLGKYARLLGSFEGLLINFTQRHSKKFVCDVVVEPEDIQMFHYTPSEQISLISSTTITTT